MSFRQPDRPHLPADRAESDRLLDAARDPRAGDAGRPADPLTDLLAAAAAPARPGELAGEEAALAAFRAARAAPASAPARAPRRRGRGIGAVAWIGAVAATATAGVAVAAVGLDRADDAPRPPVPGTAPADPGVSGPTGAGPTGSGPTGGSSAPGGGDATPGAAGPGASPGAAPPPTPGRTPGPAGTRAAANLPGLCRAYLARPAAQRAKALTTPGFAPLVDAAGGAAEVESYCRRLVPDAGPADPPAARPAHTGRPASKATPAPDPADQD
ncbi:hypothetical protein [Micromonospora carbonacea]|uniref:hypothetical protein n=1 Tax=Micromonospora carbonacea TaxID=47853 RepID=UPI003D70B5F9